MVGLGPDTGIEDVREFWAFPSFISDMRMGVIVQPWLDRAEDVKRLYLPSNAPFLSERSPILQVAVIQP